MKLDEKTSVPVGWVLGAFGLLITIVATTTFWIAAINYRLQRIEERLGIPQYQTNLDLVSQSYADSLAKANKLSKQLHDRPSINPGSE